MPRAIEAQEEAAFSQPGPIEQAIDAEAMPAPRELLLVEDSPEYAALVTEMLRRELDGVEVLIQGSVEEALAALGRRPVECVLLDLSLPDAVGLQTLRAIQD